MMLQDGDGECALHKAAVGVSAEAHSQHLFLVPACCSLPASLNVLGPPLWLYRYTRATQIPHFPSLCHLNPRAPDFIHLHFCAQGHAPVCQLLVARDPRCCSLQDKRGRVAKECASGAAQAYLAQLPSQSGEEGH